MDKKSYDEGWNQAIDRAIEIIKSEEPIKEILINQLNKEFREQ
jgi:hypothetical protein